VVVAIIFPARKNPAIRVRHDKVADPWKLLAAANEISFNKAL
jgi:hypothetical protein